MKGKILISVLVLSLAMNFGVAAMFGRHFVQTKTADNPQNCPFSSNDDHLYTLLGLTPEQQESITPVARDFHENIDKLSSEIHQKRNIMLTMMEQDPVDMDRVNLVKKEMLSLQFTLQQQVFDHILEMKHMLKPEQGKVFFQALRQSFITQDVNCNE